MNDELHHHGIKGMKWGVRRYQPYQKGKTVKGGKEVGKAKSKREIRKENREAVKQKNNPKGVSLRQLKKERVRIAKEEHAKAKKSVEAEINKELKDLSDFAKKHGLDQDDGGGGSLEAGMEWNRRLDNIQMRQYDLTSQINKKTASRLIEEYGDTAVQRINNSTKRKEAALVAASLAVPLSTLGLVVLDEIYG